MHRTLSFSTSPLSSTVSRHTRAPALSIVRNLPRPTMCARESSSQRRKRSTMQKLQVGPYRLEAISVAAAETCICLPSLSLAFDAGKCPPEAIGMRYMAITHGHCDHVHGLPLHLATRTLQKLPPPLYFVPPAIEDDVRALVDVVGRLEHCSLNPDIVALCPEDVPVELKRDWLLRPFRTIHTVPSQGYVVYARRKKLRKQYVGLPGSEIGRLRAQGVDVSNSTLIPELAFTGDTNLDAIAESEDCRNARVLITEITFLDDYRSVEDARKFGHVHIDEVIQRKDLFQHNEFVVFCHFSARYSANDILAAMRRLPDELRIKTHAIVGAMD